MENVNLMWSCPVEQDHEGKAITASCRGWVDWVTPTILEIYIV